MSFYFSKLILFGEYIILKGFSALAMPLPLFKGCWKFGNGENGSNSTLKNIVQHLHLIGADAFLDLKRFENDVQDGLYFESDIPMGYGLGSSGALCAAIYGVYQKEKITDLSELKSRLAQIENYWHGQSSGLDPLIGYLNQAVRIQNGELTTAQVPSMLDSKQIIFLLDTKIERKTAGLVNHFLENCQDAAFQEHCLAALGKATAACIDGYLDRDTEQLWLNLKIISSLQLAYFGRMIPAEFRAIWEMGLASDDFYLKLCGAGGGGFILGFARDWANVQARYFKDYDTNVAFSF